MGAQESVHWKFKKEPDYFKQMKEYNLKKSENNFSTPKIKHSLTSNIGNSYLIKKKISKIKKFNLNILYYDEHLKDNEENSDNCSFIEMNTNGTFYGCHNFELFKAVCRKLMDKKKNLYY